MTHLDSLDVAADLHQVANCELLHALLRTAAARVGGRTDFGEHCRVERPAVAARVRHHDVVVLVDAHHRARRAQTLEHAVRPAAVPVLQRLHDLQVKVDVHLVSDLEAARTATPTRVLLAQQRQVVAVEHAALRITEHFQV